jgi:hypothetical protein
MILNLNSWRSVRDPAQHYHKLLKWSVLINGDFSGGDQTEFDGQRILD